MAAEVVHGITRVWDASGRELPVEVYYGGLLDVRSDIPDVRVVPPSLPSRTYGGHNFREVEREITARDIARIDAEATLMSLQDILGQVVHGLFGMPTWRKA